MRRTLSRVPGLPLNLFLQPRSSPTAGWRSAFARKDAWERSRITGWDARCTAESERFGSVLHKVLTSVPEMNTVLGFLNVTFNLFSFYCGVWLSLI